MHKYISHPYIQRIQTVPTWFFNIYSSDNHGDRFKNPLIPFLFSIILSLAMPRSLLPPVINAPLLLLKTQIPAFNLINEYSLFYTDKK
ncbi:hypothetical protein SRABI96_04299 [Peribacillus sp. Bi96]|nr:hypothetical protein SRABI96_04299 [Peribacillus sp. Bi96]